MNQIHVVLYVVIGLLCILILLIEIYTYLSQCRFDKWARDFGYNQGRDVRNLNRRYTDKV
jgi:hypothetical protein